MGCKPISAVGGRPSGSRVQRCEGSGFDLRTLARSAHGEDGCLSVDPVGAGGMVVPIHAVNGSSSIQPTQDRLEEQLTLGGVGPVAHLMVFHVR